MQAFIQVFVLVSVPSAGMSRLRSVKFKVSSSSVEDPLFRTEDLNDDFKDKHMSELQ